MKYVYNDKGQFIFSTFDEVDNADIEKMYNKAIIIAEKLKAPKLENGVLIETTDKYITVIFDNKTKQILEVKNGYFELENSKVFEYRENIFENVKYYSLDDKLELKFNKELMELDQEKQRQEKELRKKEIAEQEKLELEKREKQAFLEKQLKDLSEVVFEMVNEHKGDE